MHQHRAGQLEPQRLQARYVWDPSTNLPAARHSWTHQPKTVEQNLLLCCCQNAIATSVPNGACGFGTLTTTEHPGLALAGISQSKSALASGSVKGCGQCLSVRCTDKEVRAGWVSMCALLRCSSHPRLPELASKKSTDCLPRPALPRPTLVQACLDPSKEVTVMVYDNCDKCGANQINLSGNIFTKLASLNVGKVDVEYKAVSWCCARACACLRACYWWPTRCLQTRAWAP